MAQFPAVKPRLFFIDNIRTLLVALVMLVHLSIAYGAVGLWYYQEGVMTASASYMFAIFEAYVRHSIWGCYSSIQATSPLHPTTAKAQNTS